MKNNYFSKFYSGLFLVLLCCIPLKGIAMANAASLSTVNTEYNTDFAFTFMDGDTFSTATNIIDFNAATFGPQLEDGSFYESRSANASEFGCYVAMPNAYSDGSCLSVDGYPDSGSDLVQYMWAQNINGVLYQRTSWSTNGGLTYCPTTAGNYRFCARTVGCSRIYETPDYPWNPKDCDLEVNLSSDLEICEGEEVTLTADASGISSCATCDDFGSYPIGSKIYKVRDADPDCSIFNGAGSGVLFQCNNSSNYDVWKAGNDLYYIEFPNQTAKIIGSVYRGSFTAQLEIDYYDFRENASSDWTVNCYTNELGEYDNYHYNGSLTVGGGYTYSIYNLNNNAYANIGYGTSNMDESDYGIGAWPRGSIGNCSEMFANFDLICEVSEQQSQIEYLWSNGATTPSITVSPNDTTTYTVTVKDCEDCEAIDSVTVVVNENPDVDAGDDVEVCEGEEIELSATVSEPLVCESGCEYPVLDATRCRSDNTSIVWLKNAGSDHFNNTINSKFEVFDNGTAKFSATVNNGEDTVTLDFTFSGYTTQAPIGSPKENSCGENNYSDFVYWTGLSGTLVSQNHGTFNVSRRGPAFQMGTGGDEQRTGFGASSWFVLTGGDGYYAEGDINLPLGACIPVQGNDDIKYVWTTADGNIISNANQQTITVDQSGTYKVTVENCASCEAEDEVVVTINEIPEVAVEDINICEGETGTLTATGTEGVSYLWNTGDDTASIEVTEGGEYSVTVTTADGCEAMATAMVTVTDPRSGTMTADATPICLDADSVQISATYNGDGNVPDGYVQLFVLTAGDDLVISGLDANPVFSVSEAGKYTIHSLVVPEGFAVPDGVTTGGEVAALLVENGGSVCASLDVPGAMIIVNEPREDETVEGTVCEGDTFTYEGEEYAAGTYEFPQTDDNGCPYLITLVVDEYPATPDETVEGTVCEGDTFTYEGEEYAAGTYEFPQTDDNGCPYLITLVVDEYPATPDETVEGTVCEGDTFTYEGEEYAAGTYEFPQTDDNGCPYLITLVVDEFPATPDETVEGTVCEGDTFTYEGEEYAAGTYEFPQTDDNGCPYLITLVVDEYPATPDETVEGTVCEGDTFTYEGEEYAAGTYEFPQTDDNGCPYLITLVVDEYPATPDETVEGTVCEGDTFTYEGEEYAAGTYEFPQTDDNGCPYLITLVVDEYPATPDETVEGTVCEGDTFTYEGEEYAAGTYEFPQTDDNGCPYLITLVVDEYPATPDETVEGTVCEGDTFTYEGEEYAAGTYEFPQTDDNGCPYLITLVVDEYPATPDETVEGTVCEGDTFTYEGEEYAAGTYEFPQTDDNGCPYLITLVVDEYPATPDETVEGTVCEGDTFTYEGEEYAAGTYEFPQTDDNGCPYLITLVVDEYPATPDETVEGTVCEGDTFTYEGEEYAAGTYEFPQTDDNGCPYLITLVVDEYPATPDETVEGTVCEGDTFTYEGEEYAAGTYEFPQTDDNGCPYLITLVVDEYPATPDETVEGTVCEGDTFTYEGEEYAAGTYEFPQTDDNGCPYLITLVVDEYPATPDETVEGTVCEGDTFTYEGEEYAAGTYEFPQTDDNGCPYLITLVVDEYPATPDETVEGTVCEGDTFTYEGEEYAAGTYEFPQTDDNGCPYLITLVVDEYPATPDETVEGTVCEGDTFTYEGEEYAAGTYEFPQTDDNGCPYLITLVVDEYPATPDETVEGTVCEGDTFTYEGEEYAAGTYEFPQTDDNGCPYLITLVVDEYPATPDETVEGTVCEGDTFTYEGEEYAAGTYEFPQTDDNGCPYLITLVVDEYPATPDETVEGTVCEGDTFTYEGEEYAAGTYEFPQTDDNGCPYLITLVVDEFPATPDETVEGTVCEGDTFTYEGEEYAAGTYEFPQTDDNGCPYLITLVVDEYPATPDETVEGTVCEGDTFTYEGEEYAAGTYEFPQTDDNGCPYLITLVVDEYPATPDETVEGTVCEGDTFTYEGEEYAAGTYEFPQTDDNGCPYLITLVVDEYPATPDETVEGTVCEGDTFTYEGEEYAAGTYEFPQTDDNGCPYLITLVVDEYPATPDETVEGTVCEGDTFTYEGEEYAAGTYEFPQTDDNGCPYLITLVVDEFPATPDETVEGTVCEGDTFTYEGEEYAAGTYEFPQTDDNGCPYLITLVVDEYPATPDETVEGTVCEGDTFTYEGEEYAAGTYEFPQTDDNGCPYLITLVVDEFDTATVDAGDDTTICEGDEVTLTATGNGSFMWFIDGSEDTIGMEASLTVSPEVTTTYRVKVTSEGDCEAEDTVTVTVGEKVIIGDYVWEDANRNGLQDDDESGVLGVTVELYQCVDDVNQDGLLVDTAVTNRFGLYSFEVCPNSGSYYIVFSDIPEEFEFTSQDEGTEDGLDSDANTNGATDCFEVFEEDDMTRDAGIIQSRQLLIGNKVRPRDEPNVYTRRNEDTACIGDRLYFWIHLEEEDLNDQSRRGNGLDGYIFTWNYPNGRSFITSDDDCSECWDGNKVQTFEIPIDEDDFGLYTIDWVAPDGVTGTIEFTLSLADECLADGSRPSTSDSRVVQVSPNPADSGSTVLIGLSNQSGSITLSETEATMLQARSNFVQGTVPINVLLFDINGKMISSARPYLTNAGDSVIEYQLGNLETGTYLIQVIGEGWKDTAKLIVK